MSEARKLSVVVRNRNEGPALRHALGALRQQSEVELEIIGVDNASTDESTEVWRQFGVDRLCSIGAGDYSPGRALNLGIAEASHEIVVIHSAHVSLLHEASLRTVHRAFEEPRLAGARCVQAGVRREATVWWEPLELDASATDAEVLANGLNCACCALRRSVWADTPFDEDLEMIEDKVWTRSVLDAGFLVRRVPVVYNYLRDVSRREAIRRGYREAVAATRAFGVAPPDASVLGLLSALTIGGLRRYARDVADTWLSYRLRRRIGRDAARPPRRGSTQ